MSLHFYADSPKPLMLICTNVDHKNIETIIEAAKFRVIRPQMYI